MTTTQEAKTPFEEYTREELINGQIIVSPRPASKHMRVVYRLGFTSLQPSPSKSKTLAPVEELDWSFTTVVQRTDPSVSRTTYMLRPAMPISGCPSPSKSATVGAPPRP